MEENKYIQKIRNFLQSINIKTFIYAILAIAVMIIAVMNVKLGNKNYLTNKNSNTQCRDVHGNIITIDPNKGEGCVDIFGAAKDYGINLDNISGETNSNTYQSANNNLTYDMSKDLILTNIYLEQNGVTDDTEKGKILSNIIKDYKNDYTKDQYFLYDLKINKNYTQDFLNSYRKSIYLLIIYYLNESKLYSQNTDILITLNENTIKNLLNTESPYETAEYQLRLINLLNNENIFLKSIKNTNSDPVKYLALGGNTYIENFKTSLSAVIDDFDTYFNSNK